MRKLRTSVAVAGSLFILLCLGCEENGGLPTAPLQPPPTTASAFIWGHVLREDGQCLVPAVVEIVDGPGLGRKSIQAEACGAWDYDGGYEFRDLPIGVTVKLRATKDGYRPQERELVTQSGGPPFQFVLSKE